ncbi:MAG: hypothetical protein ABJB97_02660 [Acidobacteriota bacterium]
MLAASTHSTIYHLVQVEKRTAKTVCGLKVAMIIEPEPVSAALHLVSREPTGHVPCSHCLRIAGVESPADPQITEPRARAATGS